MWAGSLGVFPGRNNGLQLRSSTGKIVGFRKVGSGVLSFPVKMGAWVLPP